jgi:hypothetical protein
MAGRQALGTARGIAVPVSGAFAAWPRSSRIRNYWRGPRTVDKRSDHWSARGYAGTSSNHTY